MSEGLKLSELDTTFVGADLSAGSLFYVVEGGNGGSVTLVELVQALDPPFVEADGLAVDFAAGRKQIVQLGSGTNGITLANPVAGKPHQLLLVQPADGAAGTVVWPGSVRWPGGEEPTLTETNGRADLAVLVREGSLYLGGVVLDYDRS